MADQWIEYLKTVDTPTLSNAIELLRVRPRHEGFLSLHIQQQFPEFGRMVGYAVTAHVETMTQLEPPDMNRFIELYQAVEASPKPAVVVFQEIGARGDFAAHSGEVMATCFTRLGAVGLVSDCAVRDIPEVRAMGFQYFSRGRVASHGNFRIVRVGVPVQIDGVVIQPGDVLHGDENGLIQVPRGIEADLAAKVDSVRERERKLMDYVRSAEFHLEGLRGKMVE